MVGHIEQVQYRVRDAGEGRWHYDAPCPEVEAGAAQCPLDALEGHVAQLLVQAYAEDGAPEDSKVFVRVGDSAEFGVWMHGYAETLDRFRMYEIAAEAEAYIKRRLHEETSAWAGRMEGERLDAEPDDDSR